MSEGYNISSEWWPMDSSDWVVEYRNHSHEMDDQKKLLLLLRMSQYYLSALVEQPDNTISNRSAYERTARVKELLGLLDETFLTWRLPEE